MGDIAPTKEAATLAVGKANDNDAAPVKLDAILAVKGTITVGEAVATNEPTVLALGNLSVRLAEALKDADIGAVAGTITVGEAIAAENVAAICVEVETCSKTTTRGMLRNTAWVWVRPNLDISVCSQSQQRCWEQSLDYRTRPQRTMKW
jgi:hypothetical protein